MGSSRPAELYLDEKWDQAIDLGLRRVMYGGLSGGVGGLLLFRSPAARLACMAFGAGFGLGSAYQACNQDMKVAFSSTSLQQ